MFALPLMLAPMLLAVPDRQQEMPNSSWVGKTVFSKTGRLELDPSAEPSEDGLQKKGLFTSSISNRVYAERADHVQVKTREGVSGWVRKADLILTEDAVPFFTKMIQAKPSDVNLYNRRAAAFRAIGEYDAALKDATEAIRMSPSPALYNNRAIIWHAKKDYDRAIADYAQALALNPRYPLVYANRAYMWHSKKDYDKAIADATQAIQFQPEFPVAYRARGIAWHGKKEYDKAIADLTRSLEMDAKSAQVHADRGRAFAAKKDHAKARDDFNEAVRLEPTNVASTAAAAFWLASCPDAKYRDGKRALSLAQGAQKLERNNTQVLQALAAAYAETGQFTEAVRWQEHALKDLQLANDKAARARLELYRKKQAYRQK